MNKSTTAEKIKINFSKFHFFFPFSEIVGGDSVEQLNKFVWPDLLYGVLLFFVRLVDLMFYQIL